VTDITSGHRAVSRIALTKYEAGFKPLSFVARAAATDSHLRPTLMSGVHVETDDRGHTAVIATDGRRLHAWLDSEKEIELEPGEYRIVENKVTTIVLDRLAFSDDGSDSFEFPNWRRVVPEAHDCVLVEGFSEDSESYSFFDLDIKKADLSPACSRFLAAHAAHSCEIANANDPPSAGSVLNIDYVRGLAGFKWEMRAKKRGQLIRCDQHDGDLVAVIAAMAYA
jgi:hypothetical protein